VLKVQLTGQWDDVIHKLQHMAKSIMPSSESGATESGELTKNIIQGHIDKQDLGWSPLSKRTIEVKGHGKVYVETGSLRSGITVKKVSSSKKEVKVFVGFEGGKHPSGLDMKTLMTYNEFGTVKSPARPLVRPSLEEAKPKIYRVVKQTLIEGFV
jgi:HK97 gp10 family phage protein